MKVVVTREGFVTDALLAEFDGLPVELVSIDGSTEDSLLRGTRDADALLVPLEDITRRVIENLERCRSITRFGIGVDTIDVAAATDAGIWVTNVPDANHREVATHAIALALALSRRLMVYDRGIRATGWASSVQSGMHRADCQTFGLLGMGRIGRRVAEMATAIGFDVVAADPIVSAVEAETLGVSLVDQTELLARSDILSVHVPLIPSTRGMIDESFIDRMKDGSILVNVSRGGLIDEHALAAALDGGKLAGAGIDTFANEPLEAESPLRSVDAAILTPHAAYYSAESMTETLQKAFRDAARVLRGEAPRYPVNSLAGGL